MTQLSNKIRVLQVMARLDRAGAETVVMNWYRELDRDLVQFDFVVNENDRPYGFESEIAELGGRVFRIPRFRGYNIVTYAQFWWTLLKQHPEWPVIHAHHTSPAAIYLTIAKLQGRTTFAHSHIAGRERTLRGLAKVLSRYPLRYIADQRLACSTDAARWMFGSYPSLVVQNAIDTELFRFSPEVRARVRDALNLEDRFTVGHVGRFHIQKNHRKLLEIFVSIKGEKPDAVLLLVGEGELRASVSAHAEALGIQESVVFLGSRSDVAELYQAMDVFVFPSLYEGLGVVVIEAQASGLPCVVSDVVPREVQVTDLVSFVPLQASPDEWAHVACRQGRAQGRDTAADAVRATSYHITDVVSKIERLYIEDPGYTQDFLPK